MGWRRRGEREWETSDGSLWEGEFECAAKCMQASGEYTAVRYRSYVSCQNLQLVLCVWLWVRIGDRVHAFVLELTPPERLATAEEAVAVVSRKDAEPGLHHN